MKGVRRPSRRRGALFRSFGNTIFGLKHVFDVSLKKQEVGRRLPVYLESAAIIPFDCSLNLLAVKQNNYHGRVRVDLFLVIKKFCVSLHRRGGSLARQYPLFLRTRGFFSPVSAPLSLL